MQNELKTKQGLKKVIRLANVVIISVLSVLVLLIIAYNCLILASRAGIKDNNAITDYGKIGNSYLVQVKTDNWSDYYSRFSLLFVSEVNINYEYLTNPDNASALDDVYFVKITNGEETSYVVGKIISKVNEGVVLTGDKYVKYDSLVGVVTNSLPVIAIFNYEWFLFFALLLIATFIGVVLYFTSIDLGYDIMFENQVGRELKKDVTFGLKDRTLKDKGTKKTSEDVVEEFLTKVITGKQKEDEIIPLENVKNALLVLDAFDLETKQKVFTFFASINLLNRYVKQDDAIEGLKENYYFKKYISKAVDYLDNINSNFISVYGDKQLILVDCMGMEFSFHSVKTANNHPSKEWSNLRLQPYANAIFELFFSSVFNGVTFEVKDKEIAKLVEIVDNFNLEAKNN